MYAESCYDQVANAIVNHVFQACGVSLETVGAMLGTIENMKFFLQTAYDNSESFVSSTVHIKTQGSVKEMTLCQQDRW